MPEPLDNPVWAALTGPQTAVALGQGMARHYPRDMTPFSAIAEACREAYDDLRQDLPAGLEARLFRPAPEPLPAGWRDVSARPILQMVQEAPPPEPVRRPASGECRPLSGEDWPAVHRLAAETRPGPFERRTLELGQYLGIFRDGRLVAMAGERFRLPGRVELSGIAVAPTARGQGLAAALIAALCRRAAARNEAPFLHVFPDNPAAALYERLGFRTRRRLWVLWRRPASD